MIATRPPVPALDDTDGNAESEVEQQGGEGEQHGVGDRRRQRVRNGAMLRERDPEVPARELADVAHVLLGQRSIEAIGLPHAGQGLRRDLGRVVEDRERIAGGGVQQEEDDGRHPQDHEHALEQSAYDEADQVGAHASRRRLSDARSSRGRRSDCAPARPEARSCSRFRAMPRAPPR